MKAHVCINECHLFRGMCVHIIYICFVDHNFREENFQWTLNMKFILSATKGVYTVV